MQGNIASDLKLGVTRLMQSRNSPIVKPYLQLTRLDKFPLGTNGIASPCFWGLLMGAYNVRYRSPIQLVYIATLWYLGNVVRHAAGCAWNDICDRDIDGLVDRSKNRPLVTGAVSLTGALYVFFQLLVTYLWMLSWASPTTFQLGLVGLLLLDIPYPLMKRWTYWAQGWLGVSLSWAIPAAWISITKTSFNLPVILPLCIARVCYTIMLDTIYGSQDITDDLRLGLKSTAILFGDHSRAILSVFGFAYIVSLTAAGIANNQGVFYFTFCVVGSAIFVAYYLWKVDFKDSSSCSAIFKSASSLNYVMWAGMFCDYLVLWSTTE